jgi:hypothetical protein
VESIEERVVAFECDIDHHTGNLDVIRVEIQGIKNSANTHVQNRVEMLENQDRMYNLKILN